MVSDNDEWWLIGLLAEDWGRINLDLFNKPKTYIIKKQSCLIQKKKTNKTWLPF